jgi:hypothetical protein
MSSVTASNGSACSRSSASAPECATAASTSNGARRSAISCAISGSSSMTSTRLPRSASRGAA